MTHRRPQIIADYTIDGITPEEFCAIASNYNDRQEAKQRARGISRPCIMTDDVNDKFEAKINVNDFAPEEISVKAENGCVVIECKHEEKKDKYGIVSREFLTRYNLPDYCQPPHVEWRLSARRILTVVATKKVLNDAKKEEEVVPEAHAAANPDKVISTADAAVKEEDVVLVVNAGLKKDKSPPTSGAAKEEQEAVPKAQATVKGDKMIPIDYAVVEFGDMLFTLAIKDQENDDVLPSQ